MPFDVIHIAFSKKKKNTRIVTAFKCFFWGVVDFLINSQTASEQQSNRCQVTKQQNGNTVTQFGLHALSVLGIHLF